MQGINNINSELREKIMIVDDSVTNLTIAKKALGRFYQIVPVPSGKKALELLEKVTPELILLDVNMPELDGFETLRIIKSNPATRNIPVIFLTAQDDSSSELEGLKLGAVDYIVKPFSIPLLLQRISLHVELMRQKKELENYNQNLAQMVQEKTEIISELQYAIIHTLVDLIEFRDGLTGGHVMRTEKYLEILMEGLERKGYYKEAIAELDKSMLLESVQLHDIGKIAISDAILNKPARLNIEEFEKIKTHTIIGEKAIKKAMEMTREKKFLEYAAVVAISHHEKWDGSGYPYGLKGENIPLIGRLMAMADVYDALVSVRPYKDALSHEEAKSIIIAERGKHFDPILVEVFADMSDAFENVAQKYSSEQILSKPLPPL